MLEKINRAVTAARSAVTQELAPTRGGNSVKIGNENPALINEQFKAELAQFLLDRFDAGELMTNIDAMINATSLQQSTFDVVLEPANILGLLERHTEARIDYNPATFAFDGTGTTVTPIGSMTSINNTLSGLTRNFYGWGLYIRPNNLEVGQATVSVQTPAGFVATYEVAEQNKPAFVVIANHASDVKLGITKADSGVVPAGIATYTGASVALTDQFYIMHDIPQDLLLAAKNAIVTVYPLTLSRELVEGYFAALFDDTLDTFVDQVCTDFAQGIAK